VDDDIVRSAPLFAALDEGAAISLRQSMVEVNLGRSDTLFDEGDQGDRLYVIVEGKIKLGRTSSDGRENLLAILGPGEMFGELSLFDPGPRTATATSVGDSRLIGLGHATGHAREDEVGQGLVGATQPPRQGRQQRGGDGRPAGQERVQ